jgi:molybdenum cofactor cytidylyltransferase
MSIMRDVTCVVLAAGRGERMGGDKLSRPFRAGTILDAVLEACGDLPAVVVTSPALQSTIPSTFQVVVNDEPERGMAHSLRLANRIVPAEHPIAILLGDKPLLRADLVSQMIEELGENDVVYPVRNGSPGHPVVFSPMARALVIALPDGDTIHLVRDNEILVRRPIEISDEGAYRDVDTEEDYRKLQP